MYFTTGGPKLGPILWRDHDDAIGVVGGPGDPRPIGIAVRVGRTGGGVAIWRMTVHGAEVPGEWIVVGREFRPAPENGRAPST